MTTEALSIYDQALSEQLGEDGLFTQQAIYDPDGVATTLYGIYDKSTNRDSKDAGHVRRKKVIPRFIVKSISDFDIYDDKQLYIPGESETYTIQYIDVDAEGVTVLWLR